jgi:phenylacetate-CoA ligase
VNHHRSGNLVCTTLFNTKMPLIRYDILDVVQNPVCKPCNCGRNLPIFEEIHGRKDDVILLQDGRRVTQIDTIIHSDLHIKEAQIIQDEVSRFRIKVVPTTGWCSRDATRLEKELKKRVGNVAVSVEEVSEIPRTWRGKFRIIISHVTNPNQQIEP